MSRMTASMDIQFFLDGDENRTFQGIVGNKILQRDQLLRSVDDLDNSPIYSFLRDGLADGSGNAADEPDVVDFQFSSAGKDAVIGYGSGVEMASKDLQKFQELKKFQELTSGYPCDQETIDFLLKINQTLTFENIELRNRLHYCYFCGNCSGI